MAPYILYVDDDADDLALVADTFRSIDDSIGVKVFNSGAAAIEYLQSIPLQGTLPSLILLDLNMPEMSGMQVLETIKNNPVYREIPVSIFTNSDHPNHRSAALTRGAVDFVTKPYTNRELIRACAAFAEYTSWPLQVKAG